MTEKSKLDLTKLKDGEAHLAAADGTHAGLKLTPAGRPAVFRDGKEHDWKSHWPLWSGDRSPITLGWKSGELRITAGGQTFTGTLQDGKYAFGNEKTR